MIKLKSIDPTIRILILPTAIIIVSVILITLLVKTAPTRILQKISAVNESKKNLNILEDRVSTLKEFTSGTLDDRSDVSFLYVPDTNPGAMLISQIRKDVAERNMALTKLELSPPSVLQEEINKVEVTFVVESENYEDLIDLILSFKNYIPLTTIEEVEIGFEEGKPSAEIKTAVYWASLPTQLPSLTQPLQGLVSEEQAMLIDILGKRL